MKAMLEQEVIPRLKTKVGKTKIVHRKIRTTGIIESKLYEKIQDLFKDSKEIKVAFLPGYQGVDLRLTANLKTSAKSKYVVTQLEEKIKERIGEFIYGYDEQTLEEVVGKSLKEKSTALPLAPAVSTPGRRSTRPRLSRCYAYDPTSLHPPANGLGANRVRL